MHTWRRTGLPNRRHNPERRLKGQQGSGGSTAENRGRRRVVAAGNGWDTKNYGRELVFY